MQTETPTSNIFNANNRMTTASYDVAGNQLAIRETALSYDAENRQASAVDPPQYGGAATYYRYDGFGRRVEKAVNSGLTVYVYDAFGRLAAEYTNFPNPPAACTTCYLTHDHLGSTRMVTDQLGDLISRHDYLPFGEEIQAGVAGRDNHFGRQDFVKQMFTGKERDQETNLDYFGARYYGASLGRFTSPDESLADQYPTDPQSWNLYSYGRNNPLNGIDPNGRSWFTDFFQKLWNSVKGDGWITNARLTERHRSWLLELTRTEADAEKVRSATAQEINDTYSCLHSDTCREQYMNYVQQVMQAAGLAYEPAPYHGNTNVGRKSAGPKNGQGALENSVQVKDTSPRRVGVDKANNEIVVFDQTSPGKFHGHVRNWDELTSQMQNALKKAGLTDARGDIR